MRFKPGDRVVMSNLGVELLRHFGWSSQGTVVDVAEKEEKSLIRPHNVKQPIWFLNDFWQLDPAAIGSPAWLEARAMTAAFARE